MKRLAIVLAAILPVTGCFYETCHPSVTVDWPSFLLADGSTTGCGGAGVTTIDVWVNDGLAGSFACNGPAASVRAAGADVITVEGRDSTNVIRYRDWFTVGADGCGNLGTVDAQPAEGTVDVSYQMPGNACYPTGPSFVWVYVHDDISNEIAADSSAAPEIGDVCPTNFPLTFRLPIGDYTLLHTYEMIRAAQPGTYAVVARDCNARGFSVRNPGTPPIAHASVSPVLVEASAACP
jgi:hypothetical protein